nr:hypothetical protein [Tanacetum cinerariifolium]
MALPPRDQRHQYLRFEGLQYTNTNIMDFMERLGRIYDREGHSVFTSRAWRRLFEIRGPLVYELILEFFSTFRFGEAVFDLDIAGALQFQLDPRQGGSECLLDRDFVCWRFPWHIPVLYFYQDLILRLCHMLIAYSIAGRSQVPKKVTVTDLFYLRGMDVGLVNIPYLLARYLRLFALGRKRELMISGGQFVACLAEHFGLLTEERLPGLTVIMRDLPVIDMAELVDATGAPEATEDAPVVDEGASAVLVLVQAPQSPPPVVRPARTMAQRLARVEEEVCEIRGALGEQREVMDVMAKDLSRFTMWAAGGISQLLDSARATYNKPGSRRGYAVLGSGCMRFLVESWRRYAVSLLVDMAYGSGLVNLQISLF